MVGALGTQSGTFLRRRYRCFSLSLSFLEAGHDSAVGSLYGDSPAFLIFYLIYFFLSVFRPFSPAACLGLRKTGCRDKIKSEYSLFMEDE